jgi:hypothetical protein
MEDRKLLARRRGSILRKAQIVAGAIGAIVTIIGTIPFAFLDDLPAHSKTSECLFDAYICLVSPAVRISELVGMSQERLGSTWPGYLLVIVVNTLLSVMLGTLVGLTIIKLKEKIKTGTQLI